MNNLTAVMNAIGSVCRGSLAVVFCPDNPPTAIAATQFPAAVVYSLNGGSSAYTFDPTVLERATIVIDVLVKVQGEATADVINDAVSLQEPLSHALWSAWYTGKFNNTVMKLGDTAAEPIRWQGPMRMDGYGQKAMGFRYQIDVAVQEAV